MRVLAAIREFGVDEWFNAEDAKMEHAENAKKNDS